MNITNEGSWLQLSKICYQDNWYQIYASSNGIRTFIKLHPLETYPTLKALLSLDRIFNLKNNGIYYDMTKTKQLLKNYFKFTLNLNVMKKTYELNKYTFIKDYQVDKVEEFKSTEKSKTLISTEEIKEYLDEVYDIDEIVDSNEFIDLKYKDIIKNYAIEHSKEDLIILAHNLKNIKVIEDNKNYFDKFNFELHVNPSDNIGEILNHELRHASKFTSYDDVYTVLHNDFLKSNYKNAFGIAVLEGINARYSDKTYLNEQNMIDLILLLIAEEDLKISEEKGIDYLIELLSKYNQKEKIIKLFYMMDEDLICRMNRLKYDINSKKTIYSILIEAYFNKINYMLDDITMTNIIYKMKRYEDEVSKLSETFKTNSEILNKLFEETLIEQYRKSVKEAMENINLESDVKILEHENIDGYVFIERQIYHENYIIDDENFILKRIKYNQDTNGTFIYDIYIKKEYLLNASRKELLEYVTLEGLNDALMKVGE